MPSELDLVVAKCETILAQCLVAANQAAAAAASIGSAGLAPLNSPAFTGEPTAPTPPDGDASNRISTTAFLGSKLGQPSGIATLDVSGVVPLAQLPFAGLTVDGTWNADTNDPTLVSGSGVSGHFRVVTVAGTTNLDGITSWAVGDWALFSSVWTKVPYTAPPISNLPLASLEGIGAATFVGNTGGGSASPSAISIASIIGYLSVVTTGGSGLCPTLPGGTGVFLRGDGAYASPGAPDLSAYALLNSPAFTGTATVTTQPRDLSSTAIASTQFVIQQQATAAEVALIKLNGTTSAGTSTYAAKADHIHGTDLSRAAATNPSTSGVFTHGGSGSFSGTLTVAVLSAAAIAASNGTITGNLLVSGTLSPASLAGAIVAEANLAFVDGTVGNASASKHGLLPKLSGNAAQFLNGTGGFSTPAFSGLTSASNGLTVSGSDVRIDTNNALGIGAYTMLSPNAAKNAGDSVTSNGIGNLNYVEINSSGTFSATTSVTNGQIWRCMTNVVSINGFGLFMRVS